MSRYSLTPPWLLPPRKLTTGTLQQGLAITPSQTEAALQWCVRAVQQVCTTTHAVGVVHALRED